MALPRPSCVRPETQSRPLLLVPPLARCPGPRNRRFSVRAPSCGALSPHVRHLFAARVVRVFILFFFVTADIFFDFAPFVPVVPAHFIQQLGNPFLYIVKLFFGFLFPIVRKPCGPRDRAPAMPGKYRRQFQRGALFFLLSLALLFHLFFMARKWETV